MRLLAGCEQNAGMDDDSRFVRLVKYALCGLALVALVVDVAMLTEAPRRWPMLKGAGLLGFAGLSVGPLFVGHSGFSANTDASILGLVAGALLGALLGGLSVG